jgi:hypothetical protein
MATMPDEGRWEYYMDHGSVWQTAARMNAASTIA